MKCKTCGSHEICHYFNQINNIKKQYLTFPKVKVEVNVVECPHYRKGKDDN